MHRKPRSIHHLQIMCTEPLQLIKSFTPPPHPTPHPAPCLQVHFAEEWNELHHLQIMEALGGDQRWVDRFLGEHAAVFYYWVGGWVSSLGGGRRVGSGCVWWAGS